MDRPPGVIVAVHDLKAAAQHNDKQGIIVGFDTDNGRYVVQLEDGQVRYLVTTSRSGGRRPFTPSPMRA